MAEDKLNISLGKKGMNRDAHPSNLQETEYTIALNSNYEDESGNGYPMLQNEHSNVLAFKFNTGFKVIGFKHDLNEDKTYYFLTNPISKISEIGYIANVQFVNNVEDVAVNCDCDIIKKLDTPLENTIQVPYLNYVNLLSDDCNLCLNFNINFPIKEGNIQIKDEKCGKRLYWTDNYNPQRYLDLSNLDIYKVEGVSSCGEELSTTCLDCTKLRLFPQFTKLCIKPVSIQYGGNLKAGTYEFLVAYCDKNGNEISQYFSITNPVSIFDENNTILDQTQLDYRTNLGIKLDVSNLDTTFGYYKVVVIQVADVNGATSYLEEGVHSINDNVVVYTNDLNSKRITLDKILALKTVYTHAEGITSSNGYLLQYGLKAQKEFNLQPVVNLMGGFLRWRTVLADENLYKNGVSSSLYRGYMRDEIYPFSIRFFTNEGYETALFPFINRPPSLDELELVTNKDVDSINSFAPNCSDALRVRKWQFYNTASLLGVCETTDVEVEIITKDVEKICVIENVATIPSSTLSLSLDEPFTTLEDYINDHLEEICDITSTYYNAFLCGYLSDDYPLSNCTPMFDVDCTNLTLVSEEVFVETVVEEESTKVEKDLDDYIKVKPPIFCDTYKKDNSNNYIEDIDFEEDFMASISHIPLPTDTWVLQDVKKRKDAAYNIDCDYSEEIQFISNPVSTTSLPIFLTYSGVSTEVKDLLLPQESTCVTYYEEIRFMSGTSGSVTVDINSTLFTTPYAGSMVATASAFFASHEASIEALTGGVMTLTAGDVITITGSTNHYIKNITTTGDMVVGLYGNGFTNKLHKDSLWFRGNTLDRDKFVLEITKKTVCELADNIPIGTNIRINFYNTCSDTTPLFCQIVDITSGTLIEVDSSLFSSDSFYVVIDSPIKVETGYFFGNHDDLQTKYRTAPVCGCFGMVLRDMEYTSVEVTYEEIILGKRQTYKSTCQYSVPIYDGCNPVPYEYGKFGYWESLKEYPDNEEMYNSSSLDIEESDIPLSIKDEFESYYVNNIVDGKYILNDETDFRCKPIRHYRFPDNIVTSFISDDTLSPFGRSLIFPIGVTIDNEVVNTFLDLAVKQGLITGDDRNKITEYEIFRGDRSINKGVIAKGLLYDVYDYDEAGDKVHFSNFPYNDLGTNTISYRNTDRNSFIAHPYGGEENNKFTFHSPDTHFNKPTIPTELYLEGYQFGNSRGHFLPVEGHSKWVILGSDAYSTATALAIAEVVLEAAIKVGELLVQASQGYWFVAGFTNGTGAAGAAIGTGTAIALGITIALDAFMKVGRYRYEWLKVFRDNGEPRNFASYYTSVGNYNYFKKNQDLGGNLLRGIAGSKYLKPGRTSISEDNTGKDILFNNIDRESNLFLSFGDAYTLGYDLDYMTYDNGSINPFSNSRFVAGEAFVCTASKTQEIQRNIASPYASLKNYVPTQYGNIESIIWLPTGKCNNLEANECDVTFGGDIFISRFSLKRKVPLFLVDAMNEPPLIPFNYDEYRNIGSPRFFCNYDTQQSTTVVAQLFPQLGSEYNFDCLTGASKFYVRPPSKFYLYYYGIPQFLVESEINNNFRYARKEKHENFYPNVADYVNWTQENVVSIKKDNEFYYNNTYSKVTSRVGTRILPNTYSKKLYDCLYDAPNGVIYSLQDSSEQDIDDPWLIYKPFDFHQFPTSSGKLVDLKGIESAQVLGRFENQVVLFNAIDVLRERVTPENNTLGSGGMFATRPLEYKMTDLGYAGTQHKSMVSCEFGHFWADAKRGQLFQVDQNGKNLKEITTGLRNWFKEHLPFKMLKGNIEGLTALDLDSQFKGLGLVMGWDSRFKRVLITKRDYLVKQPMYFMCNEFFSISERTTIINQYEGLGFDFIGIEDCQLKFYREELDETLLIDVTPISLKNINYFEDVSFTIGYNPITESWISYYDFKPDYYVNYHNYFQSGLNYSLDTNEEGLWSHLLTNKSYQVFYGKKYPWMIELPVKENYVNKILVSIEYWMDTRRYHNEYDFAEKRNVGFNKSWIYNNSENTGQLNLITEIKNNLYQKTQYPKNVAGATEILVTENDKKWTFNHFYNRVRNELNNNPIWLFDKNVINKRINLPALQYNQVWKDRLRGDWFLLRLQQDGDTRFKHIFKWVLSAEKNYR